MYVSVERGNPEQEASTTQLEIGPRTLSCLSEYSIISIIRSASMMNFKILSVTDIDLRNQEFKWHAYCPVT